MVSQRLAQGFQIVLVKPHLEGESSDSSFRLGAKATPKKSFSLANASAPVISLYNRGLKREAVAWLSIGHIFHKITLCYNRRAIKVVIYRPKSKTATLSLEYRYRFQVSHCVLIRTVVHF